MLLRSQEITTNSFSSLWSPEKHQELALFLPGQISWQPNSMGGGAHLAQKPPSFSVLIWTKLFLLLTTEVFHLLDQPWTRCYSYTAVLVNKRKLSVRVGWVSQCQMCMPVCALAQDWLFLLLSVYVAVSSRDVNSSPPCCCHASTSSVCTGETKTYWC